MANEPDVLLMDEPTSALDEASVRGIEELILGIVQERGVTCVIVTHNRAQAARLAGRTMAMKAGRLVAIGPTGEISNDVLMGLAQAVGPLFCVRPWCCFASGSLSAWSARRPIARGLVQMVLVGMVLALLSHSSLLIGCLILLGMTTAAAVTAVRRLKGMRNALMMCFWSIAAGVAGTVIAVMLATRSLRPDAAMLVPVGSMIIANAMIACAQAVERFRAEILAHVCQVEAGLSLGAEPKVTVALYLQSAVYASLLPRLDMLKSLGLVWMPGVMASMVILGASPVYAGIYQFIIVAMILAASGITALVATVLMRSRVFSPAAQLALRPAQALATRAPAH